MAVFKIGKDSYNPASSYSLTGGNGNRFSTVGGVPSGILYWLGFTPTIGGLFLYSGTPATQADIDGISNNTEINSITAALRYSDMLCWFPWAPRSYYDTVYSSRYFRFTLRPAKALLSGVATWFIFGGYYSSASSASIFVSGSVGAIGSGADLELDVLNFTAGNVYKRDSYQLTMPNNVTY